MAAAVKTKVWLELGGRFIVGDGGLQLLLGIVRTGSIRITPSIGNAPVAVEMFSYLDRGILVSQARPRTGSR